MKKKKKKKKKARKFFYLTGFFFLFLSMGLYFHLKGSYYRRSFLKAEVNVERGLEKLNLPIQEKRIEKKGFFPPRQQARIVSEIPFDYPLDKLISEIYKVFSSEEIEVQEIKEQNLKDYYQILVILGFKKRITHHLNFILHKIKIALLIDDFGYSRSRTVESALHLNIPLTISIIPGTPYAKDIAEEAHRNGKEIVVHLPMEPKGKFNNNYKWIITGKMKEREIKRITEKAIEEVPYSRGLNNHMGSLVTEREEIMKPLLQVIKQKNFYFVDSKTSSHSIAFSLAKKTRVRSTQRDVFLDNQKESRYIEEQFKKLILQAKKRGEALGIAHINYITIQNLKKLISQLEKRKIQLVYVSEIVD